MYIPSYSKVHVDGRRLSMMTDKPSLLGRSAAIGVKDHCSCGWRQKPLEAAQGGGRRDRSASQLAACQIGTSTLSANIAVSTCKLCNDDDCRSLAQCLFVQEDAAASQIWQ